MPSTITATIGQSNNTWSFASSSDPASKAFTLGARVASPLTLKASTGLDIQTDVSSSALVIIDMQNYFLSAALGRAKGAGHVACDNLVNYAIPAARKCGMQIIWVNWGLNEDDLKSMPPAVTRCFGFYGTDDDGKKVVLSRHGGLRDDRVAAGLGSEMGTVTVPKEEGGPAEVEAGKMLMRDTWNAGLYPPLDQLYRDGVKEPVPDVWIHKNRMSGMWGGMTPLQEFLEKKGIHTLYFTGVNTDQCVGGTLTDCFSKGYTCILLNDGCGTTSPEYAQKAWEFNCENTFGFVMTCKDLYDGVDAWKPA